MCLPISCYCFMNDLLSVYIYIYKYENVDLPKNEACSLVL